MQQAQIPPGVQGFTIAPTSSIVTRVIDIRNSPGFTPQPPPSGRTTIADF